MTRKQLAAAGLWFFLGNLFLGCCLAVRYILSAAGLDGALDYAHAALMLISTFAGIYLALGMVFLILSILFPRRIVLWLAAFPTAVILHVLTFLDTSIYAIYKFHINSMVINLITTEGFDDSVHFGWKTWLFFICALALLLMMEILFLRFLLAPKRSARLRLKPVLAVAMPLLAIMAAEKLAFAAADFANATRFTSHTKLFPLYQPFTAKRFMRRVLHVQVDREKGLRLDRRAGSLAYPKAPLVFNRLDNYPNILWIIIDGWRYDMLNADVTPNLQAFAPRALVFRKHISGGNATRFGVFSLFYGLYGTYWHQFVGERRGPVLIDELAKLGYGFKIISATRLTFPEFRKTVFVRVPDDIEDDLGGASAAEKDPKVARRFIEWLDRRDDRPFFAVLSFDAPHGPYVYPDEFEKFIPSRRTPNYFTVDKNDMTPLKNSYKNALHFDDHLAGLVLRALEDKNLLGDTMIAITSDHGEEFLESGFYGHTSAFTPEQVQVPLIFYLPGTPPGEITYLTSHQDLVPTTLSLLGCVTQPDIYSQGRRLLDGKGSDYVVASGWDNGAVITGRRAVVFSTESYNSALFEVRDERYRLIRDGRDSIRQEGISLTAVAKRMIEFLR